MGQVGGGQRGQFIERQLTLYRMYESWIGIIEFLNPEILNNLFKQSARITDHLRVECFTTFERIVMQHPLTEAMNRLGTIRRRGPYFGGSHFSRMDYDDFNESSGHRHGGPYFGGSSRANQLNGSMYHVNQKTTDTSDSGMIGGHVQCIY